METRDSSDEKAVRKEILKRAKLICSTLSVTGSSIITRSDIKFDTVIVDEAAQAIELSTLIPLKYSCKRLILIGDPNQLPATIFSKTCTKLSYDRSLFERLQINGYPVLLLNTQYRMNTLISRFISENFYEAQVKDYEKIEDILGEKKIVKNLKFDKFLVFHISGLEVFDNG